MVRWARQHEKTAMLDRTWLSCLLRGSHVLVRERGHAAASWFFALGEVKDSACLGWPAESQVHGGVTFYTPKMTAVTEVQRLVVLDLDHWEALEYRWRSPLWQGLSFADLSVSGVAAFVTDPVPARFHNGIDANGCT